MPDEVIIHEDSEAQGFYLISQGEQITKIEDEINKELFFKLQKGEYFGEISALYGCPNTATITSAKYSNVGHLSIQNFNLVLSQLPGLR